MARIHRHLRKGNYAERIGSTAPVYLAGVIEYLVAEILELSGEACHDNNKKRIIPRHIMLAIRNDHEFSELLKNVFISDGGVLPHIEGVLLSKIMSTAKKGQGRSNEGSVIEASQTKPASQEY